MVMGQQAKDGLELNDGSDMSRLISKSLKRKGIEKYFSSAVNLMRREYAPFQSRTWSNSEPKKFHESRTLGSSLLFRLLEVHRIHIEPIDA